MTLTLFFSWVGHVRPNRRGTYIVNKLVKAARPPSWRIFALSWSVVVFEFNLNAAERDTREGPVESNVEEPGFEQRRISATWEALWKEQCNIAVRCKMKGKWAAAERCGGIVGVGATICWGCGERRLENSELLLNNRQHLRRASISFGPERG